MANLLRLIKKKALFALSVAIFAGIENTAFGIPRACNLVLFGRQTRGGGSDPSKSHFEDFVGEDGKESNQILSDSDFYSSLQDPLLLEKDIIASNLRQTKKDVLDSVRRLRAGGIDSREADGSTFVAHDGISAVSSVDRDPHPTSFLDKLVKSIVLGCAGFTTARAIRNILSPPEFDLLDEVRVVDFLLLLVRSLWFLNATSTANYAFQYVLGRG